MDNLQKLLDQKWPLTRSLPYDERMLRQEKRTAFTEGYNAAMSVALHFGDHLQHNYKPDWQIGRWNHKQGVNGESISTMNLLQEYISKD